MIELIIVLAIFAVLIFFSFLTLNLFQKEGTLDAAAQELFGVLRLAQNRTLASEGQSSYGVNIETDKFTLFKGTSFNPADPDNEVHNLTQDLIISQINLGGVSAVIFERLTGTTNNSGSIKIEMASDSSQNRTVYIDSSGIVGLASGSPGDTERLADSRHIHVLYSQDTKSTVTLSLFFPDDSFTKAVDYQAGLDVGKTQFYWEGTVTVSGSDQKIKIHTHQLTDTQTLFCIHRDRRYNSKALDILLDGENIVNYSASGVVSQGSSVWTGTPQAQ